MVLSKYFNDLFRLLFCHKSSRDNKISWNKAKVAHVYDTDNLETLDVEMKSNERFGEYLFWSI